MIGWVNGEFGELDDLRIDPRDRGFLLGDGIFETLLAENGTIRRVRRHLNRMEEAADQIQIAINYTDLEILTALQRVLIANNLQECRAALRLTLTRGRGPRGLLPPDDAHPTLLITAAAAPEPANSCRATISSFVRSEHSIGSRIKSLNCLDSIMARQEARKRGADEALLRNGAGALAEASAANLFLVAGDVLFTPCIDQGALPGIMRSVVLDTAHEAGISVQERQIDESELWSASEAFLTNSLIGLCPLIEVDGRQIGSGEPGPRTISLRDRAAVLE